MMIRFAFVLTFGGLVLAAASALAQEPPAAAPPVETAPADNPPANGNPAEAKPPETPPVDSADSRYTFSRVQDGYVRLDNRTGHVSLCSKRTVGWGCQAVPEDRLAFENEIARLQDENAALKKDLATRGLNLPGGVKSEPPVAQGGDKTFKMPNDANIERMKSFLGTLWQRLVEMIATIQKDMLKKT
jgi:hypothetical protein